MGDNSPTLRLSGRTRDLDSLISLVIRAQGCSGDRAESWLIVRKADDHVEPEENIRNAEDKEHRVIPDEGMITNLLCF